MKKISVPLVILLLFITVYVLIFSSVDRARTPMKKIQARGLILPPVVVKLLSLEFRTVTADFLFARASQYFGGKIATGEPATLHDMQWLYSNLLVITDLDPYFEDPYYFGNALLTWDAGRYNEANNLLKKGTEARTWDWQLPFFLGFNKFYFLKDNKAGADYILEAAKRPGAPDFLPTLAARLYHQAQNTGIAIAFLKSFYQTEKSEQIKKLYAVRIDALEKILTIEKAMAEYRKKTKHLPLNLDVLVQAGFLPEIPADPYGGTFYIDKDGSIKTTSKLAFRQKPPTKQQ
jgi:hypothetical protein